MTRNLSELAWAIRVFATACLCLNALPASAIVIKLHGIDGKKVNRLLDQTDRLTSVLEKLVSTEPGAPLNFYIDKVFEETNKTIECAIGQTRVTVQELAEQATPKWMQSLDKCEHIGSIGELTVARIQDCKIHNSIVDKEPKFDDIISGYSGNLRVTQAGLCSKDLLPEDRNDIERLRDESALLDKAYRQLKAIPGCNIAQPEALRQCTATYADNTLSKLRARNQLDLQNIDLPDFAGKVQGLPSLPQVRKLSTFLMPSPVLDIATLDAYEQVIAEAYEYSSIADAAFAVRQINYKKKVSDAKAAVDAAGDLIPGGKTTVEKQIRCNMRADAECRVHQWDMREGIVSAMKLAESSCDNKVFYPEFADLVSAEQKKICETDRDAVARKFKQADDWAESRIKELDSAAVRERTRAGKTVN
jgi:hypothetical protein